MAGAYVFLTECADFSEAQVVKSFLLSRNFDAKIRDEQTRTVAPHLGQFLGRLIVEVPEYQFLEASQALEQFQDAKLRLVTEDETPATEGLKVTQSLAKKCLINSVLGCLLVPVLCNFYSITQAYRVLKHERPLSVLSRRRLAWSVLFNSVAFYFWFTVGFKHLFMALF